MVVLNPAPMVSHKQLCKSIHQLTGVFLNMCHTSTNECIALNNSYYSSYLSFSGLSNPIVYQSEYLCCQHIPLSGYLSRRLVFMKQE